MKHVCGVTFRGGDQYFYGRQTSHGFDRLARDHVSTSTLRCDLRLGRSFSPALEPPGGNSRCRAWMQRSTLVAKSYQVNVHSQQQNALGFNLSMQGIGDVVIVGPAAGRFFRRLARIFLRSRKRGSRKGSRKQLRTYSLGASRNRDARGHVAPLPGL